MTPELPEDDAPDEPDDDAPDDPDELDAPDDPDELDAPDEPDDEAPDDPELPDDEEPDAPEEELLDELLLEEVDASAPPLEVPPIVPPHAHPMMAITPRLPSCVARGMLKREVLFVASFMMRGRAKLMPHMQTWGFSCRACTRATHRSCSWASLRHARFARVR